MLKKNKLANIAAALIVTAFAISSAHAQAISATGTITAAPSGSNFLYTISLKNTGTTNIDTFWFAWLPDHYDFLTSTPTSIVSPTNWTDYVETGTYGKSIQFYDTASSPITPGQTNSSFQFISPDPPSTIGNSSGPIGLPVTYSYVYAGEPTGPGTDPVASSSIISSMAVTTVPEPAGVMPMSIAASIGMLAWRRTKIPVVVG